MRKSNEPNTQDQAPKSDSLSLIIDSKESSESWPASEVDDGLLGALSTSPLGVFSEDIEVEDPTN